MKLEKMDSIPFKKFFFAIVSILVTFLEVERGINAMPQSGKPAGILELSVLKNASIPSQNATKGFEVGACV